MLFHGCLVDVGYHMSVAVSGFTLSLNIRFSASLTLVLQGKFPW